MTNSSIRTDLDEASARSDAMVSASDPARGFRTGWRVDSEPVMQSAPLPHYGRLRAALDRFLSRYDN